MAHFKSPKFQRSPPPTTTLTLDLTLRSVFSWLDLYKAFFLWISSGGTFSGGVLSMSKLFRHQTFFFLTN